MKKLFNWSLGILLLWQTACSSPSVKENPSVRIRLPQDPESLHPINYNNAYALQVLNLVYQSLLTVSLEDRSIVPLLANSLPSVKISDSLSYFTYRLHPAARWDNGTPISFKDVAFSLKLLHSPLLENERWRAQFDFITDILPHPDSANVFTIVCKGYTPEMRLMTGDFFILPAHQFDPENKIENIAFRTVREKFDSLATTNTFRNLAAGINNSFFATDTAGVKGSGPYRLASWQNGQYVALEKKKGWWASKVSSLPKALTAYPTQIIYQIIPDNAAAVLALKSQQIDILDNIPLVSFQEMAKDPKVSKHYNFFSPATFDLVFMGMNGANPLLKDATTRIALAHLLNVPQIIKTVHGGYATATVGIVHPDEKKFYNTALPSISFSLSKAEALLGEAGWKKSAQGWVRVQNGKTVKLKLNLLYRAGNSDFENMGLLFQQNAKLIEVPIQLQGIESSQISERLQNRNYDLYFRTLAGNPFSYNLLPLLHSESARDGGANVTGFGYPETDRMLARIAIEETEEKKAELLKLLQQKMQEESNLVFLYFQQNKMAISRKFKDPIVSSIKPNYEVTQLKVEK